MVLFGLNKPKKCSTVFYFLYYEEKASQHYRTIVSIISMQTCSVSGVPFEVSEQEIVQRKDFGYDSLPDTAPETRIRHIGAFWPHFHLHERTCDKSGQKIVSVFPPDCPYPVWHKDVWMKEANPPTAEYSPGTPLFQQMWELFQQCPIAHNMGVGNENCEYADDWWYSRNCFLCHSGFECEDMLYCYRTRKCSDCQYAAFATDCDLCIDITNCHKCFNVSYALNCQQVSDSAFVYDCRNCTHCMFCFNLRNKEYCIGNQQLTKEQYEAEKAKWNLASHSVYQTAKENFQTLMTQDLAWHRALVIDRSEECTGNFIDRSRNVKNCYFMDNSEDCINCVRSVSSNDKNCLDSLGHFGGERLFSSVIAQDNCYEIHNCFNVIQSKYLQYCSNCFQCENCFACSGLIKKKFCILNKEYPEEEYHKLKEQMIADMKEAGEYGKFFPGYFSPLPYSESWAAVHFPLSNLQQEQFGFRLAFEGDRARPADALDAAQVPDSAEAVTDDIFSHTYWDETTGKPFRITKAALAFAKKKKAPLPHEFYSRRLVENFQWMYYDGKNRQTTCGKTGKKIETYLPSTFDGRIVSEEEYLKIIA